MNMRQRWGLAIALWVIYMLVRFPDMPPLGGIVMTLSFIVALNLILW